MAVQWIKEAGWTAKQAASVFCVSRTYIAIALRLSDADRLRLANDKLKLAALNRDYCRRLAEDRDQRLWREAEELQREAQVQAVEDYFEEVELDRLLDRVVALYRPEPLIKELEVALQRHGHDLSQLVVSVSRSGPEGLMAALDAATAPHAIAAE
jgi:hypothetical protein